jgi:branched-chain amino acid transport system permease protein
MHVLGLNIQFTQNNLAPYYYLIFLILVITLIVMYRTDNSRIGMNIRALRFSPNLAQSIGVHLMKWRVIAFAIGCIFAAIAGAFYAHYYVMVDANSFFGVGYIIPVIAWVVVGGRDSIIGTLLGAVILTILPQYIKALREYEQVAFGIILILFALVLPQGLASLPKRLQPWWVHLRRKE